MRVSNMPAQLLVLSSLCFACCAADQQVTLLDVAGGTGDIAFRLRDAIASSHVRVTKPPRIVVCDINPRMLAVGQERAVSRGYAESAGSAPQLSWVEGNAESLPFPDASMDLYTIAFGIRNVTHVDAALREAYRVLKPGGRFMCLEFSKVNNPLLRAAYDAYSFNVIPALGQAVANDRAAYQYLVESIRRFPDQTSFAGMIEDAGFRHVAYRDFTFGVCAVHSGFKV